MAEKKPRKPRAKAAPKVEYDEPSFRMVIQKGHLVPAFAFEAEKLDTWRDGTKILVTFKVEGDRPLIRRWWAILGNYAKTGHLPYPDVEAASRACKHLLGIVDVDQVIENGAKRWLTTPISLSRLSDADLERYIAELENILYRQTGIDPETVRREAKGEGEESRPYQTDYPPISAYEDSSGSSPHPPSEPDDGVGGAATTSAADAPLSNSSDGEAGGWPKAAGDVVEASAGSALARQSTAEATDSAGDDVAGVSGSPVETREAGKAGPSEPEPATIPAPAVGTDPAPAAGSELVAGDGDETATGSEERGEGTNATGGPAAAGAGVGAEGGATEPQSADAPPATLAEFLKVAARRMAASTGYNERGLFDATVKDIRDNQLMKLGEEDRHTAAKTLQAIWALCLDVIHGKTDELDLSMVAELAACKTADIAPASYGMTREQIAELKRYEAAKKAAAK